MYIVSELSLGRDGLWRERVDEATYSLRGECLPSGARFLSAPQATIWRRMSPLRYTMIMGIRASGRSGMHLSPTMETNFVRGYLAARWWICLKVMSLLGILNSQRMSLHSILGSTPSDFFESQQTRRTPRAAQGDHRVEEKTTQNDFFSKEEQTTHPSLYKKQIIPVPLSLSSSSASTRLASVTSRV